MERQQLAGQRVVITGGSRGLGLAIVEGLVAEKASVTVVARDEKRLAELRERLPVTVVAGDVTDRALAAQVLDEVHPTLVILNAGAAPTLAPLHQQTWESFGVAWETDVKATFHWVQAALRLPLERGSRVLTTSSGAAIHGSPLSGGYAGAKRAVWLIAQYAAVVSKDLDLGMRFQTLVPLQIIGETHLGRPAAEAYAARLGISTEAFLARSGKPMSPQLYASHVLSLLNDPKHDSGIAFGIKGDSGVTSLDG